MLTVHSAPSGTNALLPVCAVATPATGSTCHNIMARSALPTDTIYLQHTYATQHTQHAHVDKYIWEVSGINQIHEYSLKKANRKKGRKGLNQRSAVLLFYLRSVTIESHFPSFLNVCLDASTLSLYKIQKYRSNWVKKLHSKT